MDPGKSVEDQFEKLHPCLPLNTRIGIIGGGPSGLSAAYALSKLGYTDVTILEKYHSVGGMCESVEIEVIFHLAREFGAELEEMDSHKLALIDSFTGTYQDINEKAKDSNRIGVHAVSDIASDLTPAYLGAHGVESFPKSVQYGYTASGYGFVQDMPYAYIHEFTRTSMAGKIRRFKGGYTSLWEKISDSLPIKVLHNTEVVSVKRTASGVYVDAVSSRGEVERMEFDKMIISGSFPFKNVKTYRSPALTCREPGKEVLDMGDLEKELFSKVRTIDYYTTVLKIKGFQHIPVGFYYFGEYVDDPSTIGNPVAMQRFHADTDIFLFWSYGNSDDVVGLVVEELVMKAVKSMRGEVERVILQRQFKYFPHVDSEDMKNGFYERLESELQGLRNTYYVGGLMAFELTERNSSYAMALNLFPLRRDIADRRPKILGELQEVEFPNLSTLDGYLKHWGTHEVTRSKVLYSWIDEEGAVISQRTYGELDARAASIAHKILTSRKPLVKAGDRVLLVHLPGLDFIDAFFGCLRASVIPVPVLPPDPFQRGGQALMKIENIVKVSNTVAILSTRGYHTAVRAASLKNLVSFTRKNAKSTTCWPDLPWLHTDTWIKHSNALPPQDISGIPEPQPNDVCFLQFTSGSTGDAKGVMITHGGVIHNIKLMKRRYRTSSKTMTVIWLPQYHDMGLIGGLFTAMVSGGSAVLFSPITFIKNPLLWLQTMSKYRATHSAGPNFAFEILIRRLESTKTKSHNYDLSSLTFFMIAAEPVRHKTIKRFIELTRPFGLSQEVMAPGYGLAENCVFVSCAFGEGKPISVDWQGRVCCGYVDHNDEDVDIRIVDPESGVEIEEAGEEGEIWISSPSAGIGYWGKDELSHETFKNELQNHPSKKYIRTGDLGRTIDGNLFISGRIKDLIIVAGRNIYSADVEQTVETSSKHLRPGCCAVIGVPEDVLLMKGISIPDASDQVGLVVIAEARDDNKALKQYIISQIETRVAEEHGVQVASVQLIRPRTISKTTSGKIRRFDCLKQFIEGTLDLVLEPVRSSTTATCGKEKAPTSELAKTLSPLSPKHSNKEIVEFLKGVVSDQTGIPLRSVCATESLISYGIDSIGVVRASQKISNFLGVPVAPIDIFTSTCIADLANFLENLLVKSHPPTMTTPSELPEPEILSSEFSMETSRFHRLGIWCFQLLALLYITMVLVLPACLSVSLFTNLVSTIPAFLPQFPWVPCIISILLAPLAWITCIILTSFSIAYFGNCFLQPNYVLIPEVPIWSIDFVKWWALYKAQEVASKVLAVHLRGTVFLNYWFKMLGARIGSSVLLDTVDITDPALISIKEGAVIAEGALLQGHQVRNGVLSFLPIRIGRNSTVGPYAVLLKGSNIGEETEVPALQKVEGGKPELRCTRNSTRQKDSTSLYLSAETRSEAIYHFIGIYVIGLLSSVSAATIYFLYISVFQQPPSLQHLIFICISGAFHWVPYTLIAYTIMFLRPPPDLLYFAISLSISYFAHGLILSQFTCILARLLGRKENQSRSRLRQWLSHRITVACHLRFAKLLSGTEAFCVYLRLFGARVGKHCSIRAINAVADPQVISLGAGVHLGDFSKLIPGFYSSDGQYVRDKISVEDNSMVGSQSLLLPGSVVEKDVILGALSVAPMGSTLQQGGVYIGSQNPIMIKNTMYALDLRIEEMDAKYKKIIGNLAASLASTTLKVKSRYFHRIGACGKGYLKLYDSMEGLPDHAIFSPKKRYPVIIRHSNCLSSDDDARIDARGAAVRILSEDSDSPLLDLTLKTGKAFHARTISDFATWLVCSRTAREEWVNQAPHIGDANWTSLRRADSYTELHYYSNLCRLFRFKDGKEMYVKYKLRPHDENIGEDSGKVEASAILPPETGSIPRDEDDPRPLLFLDEDFQKRVKSPAGIRYIFQLQARPIPKEKAAQDIALDCTRPWDEEQFPYISIGEITIDQSIAKEESDKLEFNPFLRCSEVDVIQATSSSQSASLDHGRSLIYEICQHLRNKKPLPEAWRVFLEQSDVKVDLSGCPMAASFERKDVAKVTLARSWAQTSWLLFVQPMLQTILPYFLIGLIVYAPLSSVLHYKNMRKIDVYWLFPFFWVSSGILAALSCIVAKWVLVGRKKEGESAFIWSGGIFMDTIWQAFRTIIGEYFMDMTCGSHWFLLLMKLMGSHVELKRGAYADSMGAVLNPEMVEIRGGTSVGREALLFGHVYDGEGGMVKFGKIVVGEGGFVGSRAMAMPGVTVESGGSLGDLSLAMKGEIVSSR
ncbi:hypothetical protein CDL15_Pgr025410 [Punica granatum]|uniref:Carrier domain-containing protein n=1 Tax=Punica granatum TaxID=22663 RepID=A0A218W9J2_PUNGR|nr:hypothetical protein CDL15_Pgr025410 [Punica granatum]